MHEQEFAQGEERAVDRAVFRWFRPNEIIVAPRRRPLRCVVVTVNPILVRRSRLIRIRLNQLFIQGRRFQSHAVSSQWRETPSGRLVAFVAADAKSWWIDLLKRVQESDAFDGKSLSVKPQVFLDLIEGHYKISFHARHAQLSCPAGPSHGAAASGKHRRPRP